MANREKVLKLRSFIAEVPERLNMAYWRLQGEDSIRSWLGRNYKIPSCGTVGCLAYSALLMEGKTEWGVSICSEAANLLGLDYDERHALFYPGNWPESFLREYEGAKTPEQRVAVTQRRLDYFLETGK